MALTLLVDADELRAVLDLARRDGDLSGHPYSRLRIARVLASYGQTDTAAQPGRALRTVLEHVIGANLDRARARHGLHHLEPGEAGELGLAADFSCNDQALEAWSCLYHRFVAEGDWGIARIARVVRPGYSDPERHIRRRFDRGYALLAEALVQIEYGVSGIPVPDRTPVRFDHVPTVLARFVGRRVDVTRLRLEVSRNRLVTVTGLPGVGKTRLALEAVRGLTSDTPWIGRWITLARLDRGEAERAIERGSQEIAATMSRSSVEDPVARASEGIVVIDHCDPALPGLGPTLQEMLGRLPGLRLLITSRMVVGIAGERVLPLWPMAVPEPRTAVTPSRLRGYDSVHLLLDRLGMLDATFALTTANAEAVAEICRRSEGLPLLLETFAARYPQRSLAEIAADAVRPSSARDSAGSGRGDVEIRAAIAGTIAQLGMDSRLLLSRLARIRSPWTQEQAAAVAGFPPLDTAAVPELIRDLLARSLVLPLVTPSVHGHGNAWRLPNVVGEVARSAPVDPRDATEIDYGRLAWCRGAAAAFAELGEHELLKLRPQEAELEAVLDFSAATPGTRVDGLALARSLTRYWSASGTPATGERWLVRLLEAAADEAPPGLLGTAWLAAAEMARLQQRLDVSLAMAGRAQDAFVAAGDEEGLMALHWLRARLDYSKGRIAAVAPCLPELLEWARSQGRSTSTGVVQLAAATALRRGRRRRAVRLFQDLLASSREVADPAGEIAALSGLASVAEAEGRLADADRLHDQARQLARRRGRRPSEIHALYRKAALARARGDLAGAARMLRQAAELVGGSQLPDLHASIGVEWAAQDAAGGRAESAVHRLRSLLPLLHGSAAVNALQVLAPMLLDAGLPDLAGRALAVADRLRRTLQLIEWPQERELWEALRRRWETTVAPDARGAGSTAPEAEDLPQLLDEALDALELRWATGLVRNRPSARQRSAQPRRDSRDS